MLEEEAAKLRKEGEAMNHELKNSVAYFIVKEGPSSGVTLKLPLGSCTAIGRSIDDVNKTQVFSLESAVPLDDFTKKLVLNYLSKKMGKSISPITSLNLKGDIGSFKRLPDMVLNDPAISRLHAMLFFDESGAGILDLVSRNGTYVNDQEVESKSLKEGDEIELGATKIVVSFKSPR